MSCLPLTPRWTSPALFSALLFCQACALSGEGSEKFGGASDLLGDDGSPLGGSFRDNQCAGLESERNALLARVPSSGASHSTEARSLVSQPNARLELSTSAGLAELTGNPRADGEIVARLVRGDHTVFRAGISWSLSANGLSINAAEPSIEATGTESHADGISGGPRITPVITGRSVEIRLNWGDASPEPFCRCNACDGLVDKVVNTQLVNSVVNALQAVVPDPLPFNLQLSVRDMARSQLRNLCQQALVPDCGYASACAQVARCAPQLTEVQGLVGGDRHLGSCAQQALEPNIACVARTAFWSAIGSLGGDCSNAGHIVDFSSEVERFRASRGADLPPICLPTIDELEAAEAAANAPSSAGSAPGKLEPKPAQPSQSFPTNF